jgi:hypothetical protein
VVRGRATSRRGRASSNSSSGTATAARPRSSWFARRGVTLGLWVVTGLIAAGLLAYVAIGDIRPTRKERVNDYIAQVNDVERELSPEISRVNQAYQKFGGKTPFANVIPQLREAERTVATLRSRVAALDPPSDAQRLHTVLLALIDEELHAAREVTAMAVYLQRLQTDAGPMEPAAAALRKRLSNAETSEDQVRAFAAYARDIDALRVRVAKLEAPPALAPSHKAFVRRLKTTSSLSRQLREAARRRDTATATYLIQQLRRLAQPTPATRRAEIAAIKAYNKRLARVNELIRVLGREQQRLSTSLG